jgi:hypothetical protein
VHAVGTLAATPLSTLHYGIDSWVIFDTFKLSLLMAVNGIADR